MKRLSLVAGFVLACGSAQAVPLVKMASLFDTRNSALSCEEATKVLAAVKDLADDDCGKKCRAIIKEAGYDPRGDRDEILATATQNASDICKAGTLVTLAPRTEVEVLSCEKPDAPAWKTCKVRVLEGKNAEKTGWVFGESLEKGGN